MEKTVLRGQSKPVSNEAVRERLSQEGGWVVMADGLRGANSRQRSPGEPGNSAVLHYPQSRTSSGLPWDPLLPTTEPSFLHQASQGWPKAEG